MNFAGVGTSTLLTLAGVFGALTVLLYILKLRRRPVSVPFSPIWRRVLKDRESNHLFSQLKRLLSLLLQLALLALVILALGDPRFSAEWSKGRNVVVLIDTSASMKAIDVKPNRIEDAKRRVRKLISSLGTADRMLLVEMGATPRPRTTMTDDVSALDAALKQVNAHDTPADLQEALAFAADSLEGLANPEVIIFSDGELGPRQSLTEDSDQATAEQHASPEERPSSEERPPLSFPNPLPASVKLTHVPIGIGGKNVAITQFSVRRYPLDKSRYEVLLEVTNTNSEPAQVELTLLGDGDVVDVTTLALGPNERLPRFYKDLAGASRSLEAKIKLIGATDILPADDHAYALMPERKPVKVLLISPGNTYAQAALLLDEYLDVTVISPKDPMPEQSFDVTILDNVAPELTQRSGARLYLNPPKEGTPVPFRKEIEDFGFDTWDKKSPFLRWMAMGNIQVTRGHAFNPEKGDKIVGASELGPILVSGERDGTPFLALGFDPRNSDFVLRVGWPLFLLNVINHFAAEDVEYLSAYRTGRVWNIPVQPDLGMITLHTPTDTTLNVPVKEGRAIQFGEAAGFYTIQDKDGNNLGAFAANLSDVAESTLPPPIPLTLGTRKAGVLSGYSPTARKQLWVTLLLCALLLSAAEWFTYHRRVTV